MSEYRINHPISLTGYALLALLCCATLYLVGPSVALLVVAGALACLWALFAGADYMLAREDDVLRRHRDAMRQVHEAHREAHGRLLESHRAIADRQIAELGAALERLQRLCDGGGR